MSVGKSWLKRARIGVSAVVLLLFTAAFADFRSQLPSRLAHLLPSLQVVPAGFSAATGATVAMVAFATLLLAALLVGRVYCGAFCPLGILQDVSFFLSRKFPGRKKMLPYSPAHNRLRYSILVATLVATVLGWGTLVLTWLDPYSEFGRIVSVLWRPLFSRANNLLVGLAEAAGFHDLFRIELRWAPSALLVTALAVFTAIALLSALRGRLYCNTVCPVGSLLGFLAKFSAFRLSIDQSACRKCAQCVKACRAQCIELRTSRIDASRCVACYDCIAACDDDGIGYRFDWHRSHPLKSSAPETPKPVSVKAAFDSDRRAFITKGLATAIAASGVGAVLARARTSDDRWADAYLNGGTSVISPPGSGSLARFLDSCTACQLCVSACPTHVLQPSVLDYGLDGVFKPHLDFQSAFCNYDCRRCAEVCPDGAITLLALADKQVTSVGVAHFHAERCIVKTKGTDCAACSEHCPTKAVDTVPYGNNLRLPQVNDALCIGCGACQYACPVQPKKAITVSGKAIHDRAKRAIEKPATAPKPQDGFAF